MSDGQSAVTGFFEKFELFSLFIQNVEVGNIHLCTVQIIYSYLKMMQFALFNT